MTDDVIRRPTHGRPQKIFQRGKRSRRRRRRMKWVMGRGYGAARS